MPQITLHYFAIIREVVGMDSEIREVTEGTTAADVAVDLGMRFPRLAPLLRAVPVMVNAAYADRIAPLGEGDEVAFIPPVAGGTAATMPDAARFIVTDTVLNTEAAIALVTAPNAGAVVSFIGTVRNHARGRGVQWLEYEAYTTGCLPIFAAIATEAQARWSVGAVAIHHRTGHLAVGEASVVIAVAAAHRADAFAACEYTIDALKDRAPIWKKEAYADGEIWIGAEAAYQVLPDR